MIDIEGLQLYMYIFRSFVPGKRRENKDSKVESQPIRKRNLLFEKNPPW